MLSKHQYHSLSNRYGHIISKKKKVLSCIEAGTSVADMDAHEIIAKMYEEIDELELIKEAIDKQIVRRPKGISSTFEGRVGNCPFCSTLINEYRERTACSCGQRITWKNKEKAKTDVS